MLSTVGGRANADANASDLAAMTGFYGERTGSLIWVTASGLADKARAVMAEVRRADDWGLRSNDFTLPQLTAAETSPEAVAEAEIKLTLTVLKYARYARGGRIPDPSRISKLLDHTPPVQPPAQVLTDLAATDAADAYLRALHPKHPQFERLRQLLLRLRGSEAKGETGGQWTDAKEGAIAYGARLQSVVPQLHRNPQGLVAAPDGSIYSSEQGPKTDDEINLLKAGGNFGWPRVAGFKDDKAYAYGNWSEWSGCKPAKFSDLVIPKGVPLQKENTFDAKNFVPPLATFYTVKTGYDFDDPKCAEVGGFVCWPTIAPASIDIYTSNAIPDWKNSLLMPSLKNGTVFRVPLLSKGKVGKAEELFRSVNRYRDTAISPDGKTIYVAMDGGGPTRDADNNPTNEVDDPNTILAFTFTG